MSKLRDRIRDTGRRRSGGFGFTAVRAAERSPRQFLVLAEVRDESGAKVAAEAGVDALLYAGPPEGAATIVAAAAGRLVGARVDAATAEVAGELAEAGVDFLACVDETTEAAALLDERLGYVLRLDDLTDDDALRLLRPLNLDAVIVPRQRDRMTVREQLRVRRVAELTRKPLIVSVDGVPEGQTLEVWRDAGAVGVLAQASDAATLSKLLAAAEEVRPPREQSDRREAVVPAPHAAQHADDEDDPLR